MGIEDSDNKISDDELEEDNKCDRGLDCFVAALCAEGLAGF